MLKPADDCSERLGHLHARRFTTSEGDGLGVTELPLARAPHAMSSAKPPALPRIRKASLTQSDAKLYAMTQVIWYTYLTKELHQISLQVTYAADMLTICDYILSLLMTVNLVLRATMLLQGLVPMMNTPNSAPTSALQSIGTVCWPFQKGRSTTSAFESLHIPR